MAKQSGLMRYNGTIGNVRHFKIKGLQGDFAGLVGGPTGEQVLNDAVFERTRENMNEFGGSAKAGKSVRVALSQVIKQMSDPQMTGRLTAVMKKINLEDQTEARGYRAILISTQRQYLQGFAFDKRVSFEGIFNTPYSFEQNAARNEGTLTVPAFNPVNLINAPAGATHFRLINALACVSDFAFNSTTGTYEPLDAENNELSDVKYSDYIELLSPVSNTIELAAALPGSPTISTDASVLFCIGIEFYQQVGPNYYLFNSGNALRVDQIF